MITIVIKNIRYLTEPVLSWCLSHAINPHLTIACHDRSRSEANSFRMNLGSKPLSQFNQLEYRSWRTFSLASLSVNQAPRQLSTAWSPLSSASPSSRLSARLAHRSTPLSSRSRPASTAWSKLPRTFLIALAIETLWMPLDQKWSSGIFVSNESKK